MADDDEGLEPIDVGPATASDEPTPSDDEGLTPIPTELERRGDDNVGEIKRH